MVLKSIMMVSIHTMANGKKAYYKQLQSTMTLLNVLHCQLESFEDERRSLPFVNPD
jgi:hypothetical protein